MRRNFDVLGENGKLPAGRPHMYTNLKDLSGRPVLQTLFTSEDLQRIVLWFCGQAETMPDLDKFAGVVRERAAKGDLTSPQRSTADLTELAYQFQLDVRERLKQMVSDVEAEKLTDDLVDGESEE
jgi:hypothetical protein